MTKSPSLAFGVVCVLSSALTVGYAAFGRRTPSMAASGAFRAADSAAIAEAASRPHLLFRNTALDDTYGAIGIVPLDRLDGPRVLTPMSCDRVHFAAGQGICLAANRGLITSYRGELFDNRYQTRYAFPFAGIPSRARVARDGSLAALTYFVGGDSYAAAGFSTRALLVDVVTGKVVADLEDFQVTRHGRPFKAVDFNFWGVTFATDARRFYATLASGGKKHLIEADVPSRTAHVLRDDVECPSLSPDNRRIAFKRLMPGFRVLWRIHVLDLESGAETITAESRSVDDQIEWLDDRTILYALPDEERNPTASMNVWAVPADGSGQARLVLAGAESPAVVRVVTGS